MCIPDRTLLGQTGLLITNGEQAREIDSEHILPWAQRVSSDGGLEEYVHRYPSARNVGL